MVSNIWVAASDNQVTIVEDYLNSGFTANSKDPNGYTPVHAAASYGHKGLLRKLINKGGDINIQDNDGDTPLHHCEDVATAKVIIEEFNGDWTIKNHEGQTALESKQEDDETPELVQYLYNLKMGQTKDSQTESAQPVTTATGPEDSIVNSLPSPGNIEGHDIRYTIQNEEQGEVDEERRRQIEAIINGDNPEEALRELVTNAVHEGMLEYQQTKRKK